MDCHKKMDQKKTEQQMTKQTKTSNFVRDFKTCSLKTMEGTENERKFTISFSSEEPYNRWFGDEILDHTSGSIDLTRLKEIGCVLFNHDRDVVIGKVNKVWTEANRGCAEIEFDSDEESEKIYQKVKSGSLKGISVGYQVDNWEEVAPNKKSMDGRFSGPVSIAKKWTPFEVSVVSVPADPTVGVSRELTDELEHEIGSDDYYFRQLQINKNK